MREQAPMLCVIWSEDLADRVAGLVRAHPVLAPRLLYAPRRAVHAYAIALYEAPIVDGGESEAELAARLASTHPRALLAEAMPGCSARLYAILDRCGETVRPAIFYQRLHALLLSDLALVVLDAPDIDDHVLDFAEMLGGMNSVVLHARRALHHSPIRAHALQDLLDLLADHGIAAADLADRLSERGGAKALARAVRRLIDRLPLPHPGLAAPAGFRLTTTVGELRAVGRRFGNCLVGVAGRYDTGWLEAVRGQRVYVVRDDPPVVACLRRASEGRWWVEQVSAHANESLSVEARRGLERDLAEAGVRLLHGDPHRALWSLIDLPRTSDGDEADDDEVDDDVDLAA